MAGLVQQSRVAGFGFLTHKSTPSRENLNKDKINLLSFTFSAECCCFFLPVSPLNTWSGSTRQSQPWLTACSPPLLPCPGMLMSWPQVRALWRFVSPLIPLLPSLTGAPGKDLLLCRSPGAALPRWDWPHPIRGAEGLASPYLCSPRLSRVFPMGKTLLHPSSEWG